MRAVLAFIVLAASATLAIADEAPEPVASSPYGAIAAFAGVIGVITAIIIWRRRR